MNLKEEKKLVLTIKYNNMGKEEFISHDNLMLAGWIKQSDDCYTILFNNISIRLRMEKNYGIDTFKIRLSQILQDTDTLQFDIDCKNMTNLRILIGLMSKAGILNIIKEALV